ncbi:MAG: hypothetical protein ACLPID_21330, partial [Beijerinckiaceae bacterium]
MKPTRSLARRRNGGQQLHFLPRLIEVMCEISEHSPESLQSSTRPETTHGLPTPQILRIRNASLLLRMQISSLFFWPRTYSPRDFESVPEQVPSCGPAPAAPSVISCNRQEKTNAMKAGTSLIFAFPIYGSM